MEKERGAYFIQPFLGVLLPSSDISFSGLPDPAEIEISCGTFNWIKFWSKMG